MSENVAFELLTGASMTYFPNGYIPVMSLYSKKSSSTIPSIVKVLNNNGYNSEIVFAKDYYNSKKAYLRMGFEKYEQLSKSNIYLTSDKFCIDTIIERLDQKSEKPLFYMLETIEAHMPFHEDKYGMYDISIVKSNLTEKMNKTLRSYAQGIYNADEQLGRLYAYIKDYKEPTILIFLGDHLPYLYSSDGINIISELDYFNTEDDLLNEYRMYNTQALVLANFDIQNVNIPEYMGGNILFNYLVNHLDIENEQYYKWLYHSTNDLVGFNKFVSIDKDGNIYRTNELEGEMKEEYENKKAMQYKFFMNTK